MSGLVDAMASLAGLLYSRRWWSNVHVVYGVRGGLEGCDSPTTMLGVKGSSLGMPGLMLWWVLASLISTNTLLS